MSKIIFLNGCGSSGKTSIARSIQYLSDEIWLTFGIDSFITMTPPPNDKPKETGFFSFIAGQNERGPTMRVENGPKNQQLFGLMPRFAEMMVDENNNIIIDEVLLDDEALLAYVRSLANHRVYYVGVLCDLHIMQAREILREDRCLGLSNDQIDRVHQGLRAHYDLEVDTSHQSPFEVAKHILDFIKDNADPKVFQRLGLRK